MNFTKAYSQLNTNQKLAVDTLDGPVMVIAGPGTGKTQTLSLRIANILDKTDSKPQNILALTFTESAASNMTQRLHEVIGLDAYKIKITTFHSFCNEVIQTFPEKFNLSLDLTQINELEQLKIIQRILEEIDLKALKTFGSSNYYRREIIHLISKIKQEGITPEAFLTLIEAEYSTLENIDKINPKTGKPYTKWLSQKKLIDKNTDLNDIYKKYQDILEEEEKYDFNDMILFVLEKFKEDDELLAHYQETFLHILVDEFQDTNGAQSRILELLGSFDDSPNIFVVGDDDQSIFRFQGANVENMFDFIQKYPKTQIITLDESYRCPPNILSGASSLISKNESRLDNKIKGLDKKQESRIKSTAKIEIKELPNSDQEDRFVLDQVKDLIKGDTKPEEIAILYRNHKDASNLLTLFNKAAIITNSQKDQSLFEIDIAINFINLLKVINSQSDNELLFEVLNYDFLKIDRLSTFKIGRAAGLSNSQLIEQLLDDEDKEETLEKFLSKLIGWNTDSKTLHLVKLLEQILNEAGILDHLTNPKNVKAIQAIKDIFNLAKNLSASNLEYKLKDFLRDIELIQENKLNVPYSFKDRKKGVNFMTVHKAKGLEFDHVYIIRAVDKIWGNRVQRSKIKLPSTLFDSTNIAEQDPNEEERRLLYVALTRAKKSINLTYSKKYIEETQEKEKVSSQFIHEIGDKFKNTVATKVKEDSVNLTSLKQEPELNLSEEEKYYLSDLVLKFKLSITALENYLESPKDFLYKNLIRIPMTKTRYLILGTIIHKALEIYNRNIIKGEERSVDYYNRILKKALQLEFITQDEADVIYNEAKELFGSYFEFVTQDKREEVLKVEYNFSRHNVMLDDIVLTGKIDKIEWVDKKHKKVRIVDYKTGRAQSRNHILGKTKTSDGKLLRQLAFYKLLTKLDDRFPHKVEEFQLDFVKPTLAGKFRSETFYSDEIETEEITEIIKEVMVKIRDLSFNSNK